MLFFINIYNYKLKQFFIKNCFRYFHLTFNSTAMKLLITVFLLVNLSLIAQTTAIPDVRFERALIDMGIDNNKHIDGLVDTAAIQSITEIDLSDKAISDLTGIAGFVNLKDLNCSKKRTSFSK